MNANNPPAGIIEVNEANFESEVLISKRPVLVEFAAAWSRPCRILDAVLREVVLACAARAKVVRVNADDNPELSLWYNVQSIPTLLFFLGGEVRATIVGTATQEAVLTRLNAVAQDAETGGQEPPPNDRIQQRQDSTVS